MKSDVILSLEWGTRAFFHNTMPTMQGPVAKQKHVVKSLPLSSGPNSQFGIHR